MDLIFLKVKRQVVIIRYKPFLHLNNTEIERGNIIKLGLSVNRFLCLLIFYVSVVVKNTYRNYPLKL
jgi:hypothetical protein